MLLANSTLVEGDDGTFCYAIATGRLCPANHENNATAFAAPNKKLSQPGAVQFNNTEEFGMLVRTRYEQVQKIMFATGEQMLR